MTNSDIILLSIGRLLSSSTNATEQTKKNFVAIVSDFNESMSIKSAKEDIIFASALGDFSMIIMNLK